VQAVVRATGSAVVIVVVVVESWIFHSSRNWAEVTQERARAARKNILIFIYNKYYKITRESHWFR
jgi:hypothetical protein